MVTFKKNLSFFFSHAHIRDKKKDKTDYKFKDFDFIESITGDNYISYHALDKRSSFYLATPKMVFDDEDTEEDEYSILKNFLEKTETDDEYIGSLKDTLKNFFSQIPFPVDSISFEQLSDIDRQAISAIIPVNKEEISFKDMVDSIFELQYKLLTDQQAYKDLRSLLDRSMNAGQFITKDGDIDFDQAFKDSHFNESYASYVKSTLTKNEHGQIYYYDFYLQSYAILDMLGISKEKLSKKNSFTNIFNDALHSYYARYCDYFVSDDFGIRQKSKALYNLYESETKVLSVDEFIQILPEVGKSTEQNDKEFFAKLANDINSDDWNRLKSENEILYRLLNLKHKYLNHFDSILEIENQNGKYYWFTKQEVHALSDLNYRETGQLINKALDIFGEDAYNVGPFNFEQEVLEMNEDKWEGRTWLLEILVLNLNFNLETREFGLLLGPLAN